MQRKTFVVAFYLQKKLLQLSSHDGILWSLNKIAATGGYFKNTVKFFHPKRFALFVNNMPLQTHHWHTLRQIFMSNLWIRNQV